MLKKSIYLSIYDIKKILSNKIFWLITCISFIFFIFSCYNYGKKKNFTDENYKRLKNYIQSYNPDTNYESGIEYIVDIYNQISDAKENNTYNKTYYLTNGDIEEEYNLFSYIRGDVNTAYSYGDFLNATRENADTISNISIFSKSSNKFTLENIEKTKMDYSIFSAENIKYTGSRGMSELLRMPVYALLVFVFLFTLTILLILEDRTKQYNQLYNTMKNGKSILAVSKMWTLLFFSLLFTSILSIITLIISVSRFGHVDMNCSLQSFYGCEQSILNMNIRSFILLLFLLRWISAFFIGMCFFTLTNITSFIYKYTLISIIFYGIGLFAQKIGGHTLISVLHYISPPYLLNSIGFLSEYKNINFFQKPVLFINISILFIIILIATIILFFITGYSKANLRQSISKNIFRHKKYNRKNRNYKKNGIYIYEMKKTLIGHRILGLFFIAAFLIYFYLINTTQPENFDRQYYILYMHSYEGKLTNEKMDIIEAESERLDAAFNKEAQVNIDYEKGKLSEWEFFQQISKYQSMTRSSGGFLLVEQRLNYLLEKDFEKWLVYEKGWNIFLGIGDTSRQSILIFLLSCICVIISVSGIFPMEEEYQTSSLINTCKYGQIHLKKNKFLTGISCAVISCTAVYLPLYIYCFKLYGLHSIFAPAASLPSLGKLPAFISILLVLIFIMAVRVLLLILFSILIMKLSLLLKNTLKTYIAGISFLIIPVLCYIFI